MKPYRLIRLFLLALVSCLLLARAATNVVVWDLPKDAGPAERAAWKAVPSDLMQLEKDPSKASSDPGYYGREYQFTADIAVENSFLIATFRAASGKVALFLKTGAPVLELQPLDKSSIRKFELIRNAGDEVVLDVFYSEGPARFSFGKDEIIQVAPAPRMRGLKVISQIDYAIVPGFVGDDLIFGAAEEATSDSISVPAENMLLGLLKGEERTLVMTWPAGKQRARLNLGAEKEKKRAIESIEIENAGQPVFLAVSSAPGIWHREALTTSFLEKDAALDWKRPFSAKWQTQLTESAVKTTYPFREAKGTVWRGVPGSYEYPVRFEGEKTIYHLSKKVPPKGESIVYFLEGSDTPAGVFTPVDMLKSTLGRAAADAILDVSGRKLRTHHGEAGSGVHRACTCGYTEAIQAVFEKGEEVDRQAFIDQSIGDMIYFVQRHIERIDEYRQFSNELTAFIKNAAREKPELKSYLEEIEQLAQQIPQEYDNQRENMKSLAYAGELHKKTMALTSKKDSKNLAAYMELLKAWRGMGGAQDGVLAQYHMVTRKLFQDAGYLAASDPKVIETAQEIRARCKQVLRNPDGYEIWANF